MKNSTDDILPPSLLSGIRPPILLIRQQTTHPPQAGTALGREDPVPTNTALILIPLKVGPAPRPPFLLTRITATKLSAS